MIRILFLTSVKEKGGCQVLLYNLIRHLDRSCFEAWVGHVAFREGDFIHAFEALGVPVVGFGAGRLRELHKTLPAIMRMATFVRRHKIDLIVSMGAHNHVYAGGAARIARVPVIAYIPDYYEPRFRENLAIVRLALLLGADCYLTPSEANLVPLRHLLPGAKHDVLYNGVDDVFLARLSPAKDVREELGLQPG